jgi:excisionase family DNA binding protein
MNPPEIAAAPAKPYYTVADLMARWSVSRWTIYRLADEGHIRRSRIGGLTRFSAATVAAYERQVGG